MANPVHLKILLEGATKWNAWRHSMENHGAWFKPDLRKADLDGLDLAGANLVNANLFDCTLAGVNLDSADLSNARLFYPKGNWLARAAGGRDERPACEDPRDSTPPA